MGARTDDGEAGDAAVSLGKRKGKSSLRLPPRKRRKLSEMQPRRIILQFRNTLNPKSWKALNLPAGNRVAKATMLKRWRQSSDYWRGWQEAKAIVYPDRVSSALLECLNMWKVRRVEVPACVNPAGMERVIITVPCLESLVVDTNLWTGKQMKRAFSHQMSCLKTLILTSMSPRVNTQGLIDVVKNMKKLQHLELTIAAKINVFEVLEYLGSIHHVSVNQIGAPLNIESAPVPFLYKPSMCELLLPKVNAGNGLLCYLGDAFSKLQLLQVGLSQNATLDGIQHLKSLKELEDLTLSSDSFDRDWLNHLCISLGNLRRLNLEFCCNVTDEDMEFISKFAALEELCLSARVISDVGLKLLSKGSKRLRKLCLHECRERINRGVQGLRQLSSLEEVELIHCLIQDIGLQVLCEGNRLLRRISLSFCDAFTDNGIRHIAGTPHLIAVELISCNQIGNDGMIHLGEGTAPLLDLTLWDVEVTERGLAGLSKGLKSLKRFRFSSSKKPKIKGLIATLKCFSCLEELQGNFSRTAKEQLRRTFPHLQLTEQKHPPSKCMASSCQQQRSGGWVE